VTRAFAWRRPDIAVLLIVLLFALTAAWVLPACGAAADPFAGLYWEPSTGRRVEIRVDGDAYQLVYGAGKRAFPAAREGDELRIAEPMGGATIVRPGEAEGTLEMIAGGETTVLKPLPQHQ